MPKKTDNGLASFEEADSALRHLGAAMREQARLTSDAQAKIDAIKAQLAIDRTAPDAEAKALTKLLTAFVKRHMAQIGERTGGAKTIQLAFGRLGMRTSPPALVFDKDIRESDVVFLIRREHPDLADVLIKVAEKVDREALKEALDDAQLQVICCSVEQNELVVIEPALDVVTEEVADVMARTA